MRKPRIARTDRDAFDAVLGRLEGEVGRLLALLLASSISAPTQGNEPALTPFWSFVRMLFPIAESIADLIYQKDNATSSNLIKVLENEFERVRRGYNGKANVIALMYRHSLTHTDEARALYYPRTTMTWKLSFGQPADHLKVRILARGRKQLQFDLTTFYEDLRQVCRNAQRGKWGRKVAKRYNGWLLLNLTAKHQSAINEIKAL